MAVSRCPNCSAELIDEYCCRCGQRRIHPQDLSARHFFAEVIDEITSLNAKFKTVRTLRGLLIPGFLTREYLEGRRQPLLSPFKIYLVCAAIFFLSAPVAGFRVESMIVSDQSGDLGRLVSARASEVGLDRPLFAARFDIRVQTVYTIIFGATALVFALMLQLLYRKGQPYGAHLIFALHYISFMYLVTIAAGLSRTIGLSIDAGALIGYAVIMVYAIVALKRVHSESMRRTLLKGATLLLLTLVLNAFANFIAIRITLALV